MKERQREIFERNRLSPLSELERGMSTFFLSREEVILSYRQAEGGRNRQDIEEMISWYGWKGPIVLDYKAVGAMIMYCDFTDGSPSSILTEKGRQRSLRTVAQNYLNFYQDLPIPYVESVNLFIDLIKSGQKFTPVFLLHRPYEFYNGQVVDGVHRLIAAGVCWQKRLEFTIDAFVGYDINPLGTQFRWFRNKFRQKLSQF